MKVGIFYNPISGRGKAEELGKQLESFLTQRSIEARLILSPHSANDKLTADEFADLDALVVAGGDGTIMRLLNTLADTQIPVYMLPLGNESLFSKEFGMTLDFDELLRRLHRRNLDKHYFAVANSQPFFSMLSVGLDSQVIERLAKIRSGPVTHLSYVGPTISLLLQHKAPTISLKVDGEEKFNSISGYFIVANCKQYALQMRFVPEATSKENKLHARFFPYKSILGFTKYSLQALLKIPFKQSVAPLYVGEQFEITTKNPYPTQADGDPLGNTPLVAQTTNKQILVLH